MAEQTKLQQQHTAALNAWRVAGEDPIRQHLAELELEVVQCAERVAGEADDLARRCRGITDGFAKLGVGHLVNSFDEIQGKGSSVDAACAAFAALRRQLETLRASVNRAEKA